MGAAEKLGLEAMGPLPWVEICVRYPDQYVCLVDLEQVALRSPDIKAARVVGVGPTRRAAFEAVHDLRAKHARHAVRFTGVCTAPLIRPELVIDDETLELLRS